tara:strand:- start:3 stop:398 length:396 start_codon:yes stop_codon:yes gene_type:complete
MRNNRPRRNRYRHSDRGFRRNNSSDLRQQGSISFNDQRRFTGRSNHNAAKLLEKYNNLAREALSSGDKILSENYYQYADHFLRVVGNKNSAEDNSKNNLDNVNSSKNSEDQIISDSENNTFSKISNNQKEN